LLKLSIYFSFHRNITVEHLYPPIITDGFVFHPYSCIQITTGYDVAEDSCKSLAVNDFKAGEQVCIFYGERSNADLLVHNGFVFEGNIHDKVGIQLGVSKSDPLFQKKEKLLSVMKMTA